MMMMMITMIVIMIIRRNNNHVVTGIYVFMLPSTMITLAVAFLSIISVHRCNFKEAGSIQIHVKNDNNSNNHHHHPSRIRPFLDLMCCRPSLRVPSKVFQVSVKYLVYNSALFASC